MNTVKHFALATAALVALSGLALSAEEQETIVDEPGAAVKGYTGSGTGGTTVFRSYSSRGPGGVTVYRSYSSAGAGGATLYRSYESGDQSGGTELREERRTGPGEATGESSDTGGVTGTGEESGGGAGGATFRSYSSSGAGGAADWGEESGTGAGGAAFKSYSSRGTGGSTHGAYGIDVDTRTGGSYPGVSPDTTTGTDTSQGMGGITGGRSGSYKFGIPEKPGTMGTYSSSTGTYPRR